jgi:WD40 repeat protein
VFTKDGRFLISPGPNLTMSVWNYPEGTLARSLAGPATRYDENSSIQGLALSPDETKIAASGFGRNGRTVRVFSFDDGSEVCAFDAFCGPLQWLSDSSHLLCIENKTSSPGITCYSVPSATEVSRIRMPLDWTLVGAALDSADAVVAFYRKPGRKDAKLARYRIEKGNISQKASVSINVPSRSHETAFAFSAATDLAAIAQGHDEFVIYDVGSRRHELGGGYMYSGGISFDASGTRLAGKTCIGFHGDNRPYEDIDITSMDGDRGWCGRDDDAVFENVFRGPMGISWAPDGRSLATCSAPLLNAWLKPVGVGVELWDVVSGKAQNESGHRGEITSLVPAGSRSFASAGADGTIRMWNIASGREDWIRCWPEAGHRGATVQHIPDESLLVGAGAGPKEGFVRTCRAADGEDIGSMRGHSVCWDPDRRRLWVVDETIGLYIASYATALAREPQPAMPLRDEIISKLGPGLWAPRVSLQHGGRWIMLHNDKELVVAEWPGLADVYRVRPKTGVSMAALTPTCDYLLFADNPGGEVTTVDIKQGAVIAVSERRNARDFEVGDVLAVSQDSKLFAWGKRAQRVEVFELHSSEFLGATPKWLPATAACFLDATTLLVGGADGLISTWPLATLGNTDACVSSPERLDGSTYGSNLTDSLD